MNDQGKTDQKIENEKSEKGKEENDSAIIAPFSNTETTGGDSSLQALVREEQSFARRRLIEKLGREPTTEELNKWLSGQTEGY